MNHDENDFWPPNKLGYACPRKNGKFVKGNSGNPRGRPPKKKSTPRPRVDKSTMESVLKVANREVIVRDGENVSRVSAVDAVIQTMAAAAMKGSVPAQKAFVELVHQAQKDQAAEIRDDHTFWENYAARYDGYLAMLQKMGEPLPKYMVHPEDLVFEDGRHVTSKGGHATIAAENRASVIWFRDTLMLQAEHDRRLQGSKHQRGQYPEVFVSDVLCMLANSSLPKRMQLSEDQILFRMLDLIKLPRRSLENQLRVGWGYFCHSYQRNQTTSRITERVKLRLRSS